MRPVFCGKLDHDARQSELDRLFSKYGRVDRIDMNKILDRVVSVEYAFRDDDDRDEMRGGPRRGGNGRWDDSPYGRSDSPGYKRGRPSPDYGRARSPVYARYNGSSYDSSRSPDYGRHRR
ncbi:hypothetical protein BHM03_00009182 [Ensete ventricosum]|nr:hypothetical protein BHM03_00009182 [Ensete ventricosum]